MRIQSLLGVALSFAALFLPAVSVDPGGEVIVVSEGTGEPFIVAASFPENNPFGHVVNGERNILTLTIETGSDKNVTLVGVAGSFHNAESGALIKNLTATKYGIPLYENGKMQVPYVFYSEFKPGDLRLNVWVDHTIDGESHRATAFDSIVTIVEPPVSLFDWKLLSTYLVVAAIFGGAGYAAYLSYLPAPKKKKTEGRIPVAATATATGVGYEEEWIPEHHLRRGKSKKGGVVSGEELSGGETSGAETKSKKGRK